MLVAWTAIVITAVPEPGCRHGFSPDWPTAARVATDFSCWPGGDRAANILQVVRGRHIISIMKR